MTLLRLDTVAGKHGSWRVELRDDAVELVSDDGRWRRVVPRNELAGRFDLVDLWGGVTVLNLPVEGVQPRLQFRLTPEQRVLIEEWKGPRTLRDLQAMLLRRYAFAVPIGIVFLLLALPMEGDPATGLEPRPVDPITAVLGAGLLLMSGLSRWRPDPRLLWLDSAWFCLLLLSLFRDILTGESSIWWLLWGVILVPLIHSGPREYRRYRHLVDPPSPPVS